MYFDNEDPLGFTRRTAALLDGLGAGEIIPEFKKRNISTTALAKLSKDDFMLLGASDKLAEYMFQQFALKDKARQPVAPDYDKMMDDFYEVLKTGKEHLHLIKTFLAYSHKRLKLNPRDFIVDQDRNERASQILQLAASATIQEVNQLEDQLVKLLKHIDKTEGGKSHLRELYLLTFIAGLGLSLALIYRWRH